MSVGSVSNLALYQATLSNINQVESNLATQQMQLSSGNADQNFSEMGGQTQQYLSLDSNITRTNQYLSDNQVVETRLEGTSSALTQVIQTGNSLESLISSAMSATGNTGVTQQLQGLWQQLTGALNTSVAGQYLFSGTAVNTPAVDTQNYPTLQQPGVPDDSYYLGSQQDMTTTPQDNTTITYNVRADAPAFQNIFAALAMASQGSQTNNTADLQQAYNLVQTGLQQVTAIQAGVNANTVTMKNIDTNNQSVVTYWQGIKDSIGNTNILTVSTQVAVNQGILQASFQAFSTINSLRLSDYLK